MKSIKLTGLTILALLVVALVLQNTSAYDKNRMFKAFGAGNEPCREFDAMRDRGVKELTRQQQEMVDDAVRYWLSGFATAWNYFSTDTYDITGGLKYEDVVEQVEKYCERNPDKKLVDAVIVVGHAMHPRRIKEMPSKK